MQEILGRLRLANLQVEFGPRQKLRQRRARLGFRLEDRERLPVSPGQPQCLRESQARAGFAEDTAVRTLGFFIPARAKRRGCLGRPSRPFGRTGVLSAPPGFFLRRRTRRGGQANDR